MELIEKILSEENLQKATERSRRTKVHQEWIK